VGSSPPIGRARKLGQLDLDLAARRPVLRHEIENRARDRGAASDPTPRREADEPARFGRVGLGVCTTKIFSTAVGTVVSSTETSSSSSFSPGRRP
jgi:hypothetical protein